MPSSRRTATVLDTPIDALDWPTALDRLADWGRRRESRVVCLCNVHSLVTARRDADFGRTLREADMAAPDGAPVAWMLRRLGHHEQPRLGGPDLMLHACARAAADGIPIYLYGGTPEVLQRLESRLRLDHPALHVAGRESPPFRPATAEEDAASVQAIHASGAGLVFVGLGCPKQERWMAAHRGRVQAVMLGVGAAFDFHAGTLPRAPRWMREAGLEWLHRLAHDPRRLWRRYLETNPRFVAGALRQLWTRRRS